MMTPERLEKITEFAEGPIHTQLVWREAVEELLDEIERMTAENAELRKNTDCQRGECPYYDKLDAEIQRLQALPQPEETASKGHRWAGEIGKYGYDYCKICGMVRRADDKNNPCRGKNKVTFRGQAQAEFIVEGKCVICGENSALNEGICGKHGDEVAQAYLFGFADGQARPTPSSALTKALDEKIFQVRTMLLGYHGPERRHDPEHCAACQLDATMIELKGILEKQVLRAHPSPSLSEIEQLIEDLAKDRYDGHALGDLMEFEKAELYDKFKERAAAIVASHRAPKEGGA